jgi:uncharacterized protein YndB with AHSA1/START domain
MACWRNTATAGSRLRDERHFDHSIERVWAALTETAEMVAWWGDADVDRSRLQGEGR